MIASSLARSSLVLERNLYAGAIGHDLPVLDLHVELPHLGDPEVAERLRGGFHRILRRVLPRGPAGPDDVDDTVHALSGSLLSHARPPCLSCPCRYASRVDLAPWVSRWRPSASDH